MKLKYFVLCVCKYLILALKQPISMISKKYDSSHSYYNMIVKTCCALLNLSPSVVKKDEEENDEEENV